MGDSGRDERLREAAANRGLKLVKSRVRTPGKGDYGRYGLTDAGGGKLLGFGKSGLTATAEEIEDYLHKGALADWKTSLRAAGAKAAARPEEARRRRTSRRKRRGRPNRNPSRSPNRSRRRSPSGRRGRRTAEAIAGLVTGLGYEAGAGRHRRAAAGAEEGRRDAAGRGAGRSDRTARLACHPGPPPAAARSGGSR